MSDDGLGGPGGDAAVPVLLYHDVTAGRPEDRWAVTRDALAAHLDAVLDAGCAVLTASELAGRLAGCAPAAGTGDGPPAPVAGPAGGPPRLCAITFDDGFAGFADRALPLLAERGLVATLYLTTGLLGRPGMLSRAAAVAVHRAGGVEVGAHAVHHRHLDLLPIAAARAEVEGSRQDLAALTGERPRSFAYPHGSFRAAVRDLVRAAGYDSGYAVKNAFTHPADDRYALARLTVTADTPVQRVRDWLSGTGAPLSWRGERLRTKAFRRVRALRAAR